MNKAVFLDRDGTIIRHVPYLSDTKKMRLLPLAALAIRRLNRLGFLLVIITNQPVIARGLISEEGFLKMHTILINRLENNGAKIDKTYYCPHHPNATLKKYRSVCSCRKPEIGMIKMAAKELNIDIKKSFFIGDETMDIALAKKAGLRMILLETGWAGKDDRFLGLVPDFVAQNLDASISIIKRYG